MLVLRNYFPLVLASCFSLSCFKFTRDVSKNPKYAEVMSSTYCAVQEIEVFKFSDDPITFRLSKVGDDQKNVVLRQFVVPSGTKFKVVRIDEYHHPENGIFLEPFVEFTFENKVYQANAEWVFDRGWGRDYLRPIPTLLIHCH